MSKVDKLRAKATKVLRSPLCNLIRFEVDNIKIQYLMYAYVGDLIEQDKIHITVGDGNRYFYLKDTMQMDSSNPEPNEIVHEATHALIDATNSGKSVTRGTHEVCAYVAEMVYALATTGNSVDLITPGLTRPVWLLAKDVLASNVTNNRSYTCPYGPVETIKGILATDGRMNVAEVTKQDGIRGA